MKTIYKYKVPVKDRFFLRLPVGAEILTVQTQYGEVAMWAIVDNNAEKEMREFRVAGTGHDLMKAVNEEFKYIGTFQLYEGKFIGHMFEVIQCQK